MCVCVCKGGRMGNYGERKNYSSTAQQKNYA